MIRQSKRPFGSIRRLPSGRYQVRWTHPLTREPHTAPRTFVKKAEASRYLAEVETDLGRGTWADPRGGKTPFEDWVMEYIEGAVRKRPSTLATFKSITKNHLLPAFGRRPIGTITSKDAQWFVRHAVESGATRETVRTRYAVLREVMNGAVDRGLIGTSPCHNVNLPPAELSKVRFLSPYEVERLARAMHPQYSTMVYVAGVLGLRWSEVAGLRVRCLDLLNGRLAVVEAVGRDGNMSPLKTKASRRTISLPSLVSSELAAHLSGRGLTAADSEEVVFTAPRGGLLVYTNWHKRDWAPAVEKAGLPGFRFHWLRHTAVGLMVQAGVHPKVIQERVGHSSYVTTMDIYAHLFSSADDKAAERVDSLFRPAALGY